PILLSRLAPPQSTLFPYTTLFRSGNSEAGMATGRPQSTDTDDPGAEERVHGYPPAQCHGGGHPAGEGQGPVDRDGLCIFQRGGPDRKSTRLNSSHVKISYAVFCLK